MRLLLDSCVWGAAAQQLAAAGHDVRCVGEMGPDPGDDEALQLSIRQNRALVTLDKDFGELVFVLGRAHRGILRLVNIRASRQGQVILGVLESHAQDLEAGALIVVTADRIRIRTSEGQP